MSEQSASTAIFVARLNIEHFKKKLAAETDESQRKRLLKLLADEEAKLAKLEKANDGEESALVPRLPLAPMRGANLNFSACLRVDPTAKSAAAREDKRVNAVPVDYG